MDRESNRRFNELAKLGDGWLDGDGEAPTEEAITLARELVTAVAEPPTIYPTPEGGVQLIFRVEDSYVEIETDPDGTFTLWIGLDD